MLSTGEWIRMQRVKGLRELKNSSGPVFNSAKPSTIQGNLNVGSVRSIRQTGSSKIRNVASDFTALVGLRTGTFLSKAERLNPVDGRGTNTPATTVTAYCGCQTGTVEKVGLCPTCRNL